MTEIQFDTLPAGFTPHTQGRRISFANRLQAAFGAFVAPEKFAADAPVPGGNSRQFRHSETALQNGASLSDSLALPPDWHGRPPIESDDLLSLSFLPFDR